MNEFAAKRIQKELAALLNDPPAGCSIIQMGEDLFRWQVEVQGPPDSPFEGGIYTLRVTFPETYPFKAPRVQFATEIFHPNINRSGDICLDTLSTQWVPSLSMAQVMLSITLLLSNPNPSDPINMEAAMMLREHPEAYTRRVQTMTRRQNSGRGGEARCAVGERNEGVVAGPDTEGEAAREQAAEQEDEDQDEVVAGAAAGVDADAEINRVDGEEAAAEVIELADHGEAEADVVNNEEEAAGGEGVDAAEGESGEEANAEEGA